MIDYKTRCADCANLIGKNKEWCCDECFGQKCAEIDECPCGVDEEALQKMKEAEKVKIDHQACGKVGKTDRKPRTTKVSDEKTELFTEIHKNLKELYENVTILKENKLLSVVIGGKTFKIDVIEQRPPKK